MPHGVLPSGRSPRTVHGWPLPSSGTHTSGGLPCAAQGSLGYRGSGMYHSSMRWWMSAAAASRRTAGCAGK
eukprot:13818098-Alexandrium_andersonii.AAC.1